jgi:hypothetical protein
MRALILLTVYRRYHELSLALARLEEAKKEEFRELPIVWIVWAQPELARLWYFRDLLQTGKINRLLTREKLPQEGERGGTTYPESHNLQLGLQEARQWLTSEFSSFLSYHYVVVQAADILPKPGAYRYIDDRLHGVPIPNLTDDQPWKAVVFHWENACCGQAIWHTNFFAVPLEEDYWPPLSTSDNQETLERQWGLKLQEKKPYRVFETHNSSQRLFFHQHLSEQLPVWPLIPLVGSQNLSLYLSGTMPWYRRLYDWCMSFWRKT